MTTCEQCRDEMAEFALGQGDAESRAAMNAHLAACVVCRRELAETESAWAALPLAFEPAAPSDAVFQRILARIDDAAGPALHTSIPAPAAALTPRQRMFSYVLAASVLFAIVGGALNWGERPSNGPTGDLVADQALHDLAQRLGKLQELEQMLNTSGVRLTALRAPVSSNRGEAYVVWDTTSGEWHFFATDLKPVPAGKAYQLWAVVEGEAPLAGPTFDVNPEGLGSVVAKFTQLKPGAKAIAFITLEPSEGSTTPSDKPILEAKL